jgi:hypothetical protein
LIYLPSHRRSAAPPLWAGLCRLGRIAQGFAFGQALPAPDIAAILRRKKVFALIGSAANTEVA